MLTIFSTLGGFGMVMTHRKAAVFTARRIELCEIVQSTLLYLHPDSRVHSYLSPLPYQVITATMCMIGFTICFYLNVLIWCSNIFSALYSVRHAPSACVRPGQRERPRVRESYWVSVSGYVSHLASISINPDRSISTLVFVEGLQSGIIHFIWTLT